MQNAGQQYGQGGASSHQTAPFGGHSETTTTSGSITSSLRQFRRKNEDKQSHSDNSNTSTTPNESHVARVAPHSHYPPRPTAESYRYPPQYPDYALQQPVKYSEISEPHPTLQDHISASVIQKTKSKEYMEMCNVQQQHIKPSYDHLNGQQCYPDANVHPHAQYISKEPQVHPAYKPESQYFPKDPQYSPQIPHQISKYNMGAQVRKYPPENDFLSKLRRIHPTMARSIMSDHHLQESQSSYQPMDQNRMYPHHQNQRYMNYPSSMQNNTYPHQYMPYSNYSTSCSYNRPPQMTPRFPPVNPHDRSMSPRRGYGENMGLPMNYGGIPAQKMPPNYPQYNTPEYAQHYQHRRAPMPQEYYQQHCSPAQYLPPHQMPPQEMTEGRVTVSDSIKHYIENWADEETATEMNQLDSSRICKEGMRGREEQSTETVYMINASELQYLENGLLTSENGLPVPVVTSETGQYIIKGGVSLENGSEMVRIVEKSSQLEIDPATGERVVNLHIMDTAKPDCMLANKPNESNQRQPTDNPCTVPDKPRVVVHQNTVITSGVQSTNKELSENTDESIKIGTSLPIITDTLEEELSRSIINECRKETADKNCSPINLDQIEQFGEQEPRSPVKSSTDCLVEEIASIQEIPNSPKSIPFDDAHTKTDNEERHPDVDDPHKDIEKLLDDTVDTEAIEPQIVNDISVESDKVSDVDNAINNKEINTNISKEESLVEETLDNETEEQSIIHNLSTDIVETSTDSVDKDVAACINESDSSPTSNETETLNTEDNDIKEHKTVNSEDKIINAEPIFEEKNTERKENKSKVVKSDTIKNDKYTTKRSRRFFSVDDIINNIGKKVKQPETDNSSRRCSLKTTKEFLEMECKNIFKFADVKSQESFIEKDIHTNTPIVHLEKPQIPEVTIEKTCEKQSTNIPSTTEECNEAVNEISENENLLELSTETLDRSQDKIIDEKSPLPENTGPSEEVTMEEKDISSENLEIKTISKANTVTEEIIQIIAKENTVTEEIIFAQEAVEASKEITVDSKATDSQEAVISTEIILETTTVELPNTPQQNREVIDKAPVQNMADSNDAVSVENLSTTSGVLKDIRPSVNAGEDTSTMSTGSKGPDQSEVHYRNVIRVEESSVLLEIAGELVEINVNNVNGKNIITVVPISDTAVVDYNDNYETLDNSEPSDPLKIDEAPQEQESAAEVVDVNAEEEPPEPEIVETTSEIIIGMDLSLEEEIKLDVDQPPILCTKAAKKAYDCDLQIPSITTSGDVLDNNRSEVYNSNDKVSSTKQKTRKIKKKSKPDSSKYLELPKRKSGKPDKRSLFRDLIAARNRKKLKLEQHNNEDDDFVPFKDLIEARRLRKSKLKEMKNNEDSKVDSTIKIDETSKDIETPEDMKDDQAVVVDTKTENIQTSTKEDKVVIPSLELEKEKPSEDIINPEKVEHKIVKRVSFSDLNQELVPINDNPPQEATKTEEQTVKEVKNYVLEDPRLNRTNGSLSKSSHGKKKLTLEEYNRRKRKLQDAEKAEQTELKKAKIDRHHSVIETNRSHSEKIKQLQRPKSMDDLNLLTTKEIVHKRKLSFEYSPVKQNYFDWEETQSPKLNLNRKDHDAKLCEFKGLITESQKSKPKVVIDVNDFNSKPSTESSEDEILQNYKEQVESKLSTLNIQIPRQASKSLERQIVDPFSKPETNTLIERFLKNDKLNSEEMEKIRKIISYKRLMQQLKKIKSHDLSRTSLNPSSYEVRKDLSDKQTKLLLKKVSEKKKSRFRNLHSHSESESETDVRDKTKCSGDYSVVQSNCLAGVVPKLIIKRKTEMPLPFVRLERLDLGLLDENNRYAV